MIVRGTDLGVSFAGRVILRDLTLELDDGDQCALTGRSGSGKTTLLLVLAGLLEPSIGRVELQLTPRDVVYVPQAPSLIPELSALQNASLGLRLRGVPPKRAELAGLDELRALGLPDVEEALPADLSGGMQQRVALARALAVQPRLLLVDEPTGTLDQATGNQVMAVLRARAGTLVVATHDPNVAAQFSRQLVLDKELVG